MCSNKLDDLLVAFLNHVGWITLLYRLLKITLQGWQEVTFLGPARLQVVGRYVPQLGQLRTTVTFNVTQVSHR